MKYIISKNTFHKLRNEIASCFNVCSDDDFMALDNELPKILEEQLNVKVNWDL